MGKLNSDLSYYVPHHFGMRLGRRFAVLSPWLGYSSIKFFTSLYFLGSGIPFPQPLPKKRNPSAYKNWTFFHCSTLLFLGAWNDHPILYIVPWQVGHTIVKASSLHGHSTLKTCKSDRTHFFIYLIRVWRTIRFKRVQLFTAQTPHRVKKLYWYGVVKMLNEKLYSFLVSCFYDIHTGYEHRTPHKIWRTDARVKLFTYAPSYLLRQREYPQVITWS